MYKYGTLKPVSHFTKGEEADNGVDEKNCGTLYAYTEKQNSLYS
jgi:hypothetical protein